MDSSPPTGPRTTRSSPSSRLCFLAASALLAACSSAPAAPAKLRYGEPQPVARFPADRKAKLLAKLPEIEEAYRKGFAGIGAPGMAVGLILDGELVWSRGFGVRDLDGRGPVDADTVFRIAS